MSEEEAQRFIERFKAYIKEVASSRERTQEYLVSAGSIPKMTENIAKRAWEMVFQYCRVDLTPKLADDW